MALFSRPSPERVHALVRLTRAAPDLRFQALVPGVDNFRHDVHLSPSLVKFAPGYILRLFVKHSPAGELLEQTPEAPRPQERAEFKRLIQDVLVSALGNAKAARNQEIDLLANVALFKYLGWEQQHQYARIVQEGRNKLKMFEGPRHERNMRAFRLKEIFSDFQANKKNVLRRVSSELLTLVNEVQADVVRRTRESFFGGEGAQWFAYFSNPLAFTDNGRDDYIHLAKYALFGNFHRDPDLYERLEQWLKSMLKWVDSASDEARELTAAQEEHERLKLQLDAARQRLSLADRTRGLGRFFGQRGDTPSLPPPVNGVSQLQELDQKLTQAAEQMKLLADAYGAQLGETLNAPENIEEMLGIQRTEQALSEARGRGAPRDEVFHLEEKLEVQRYLQEEFYLSAQQLGLLPCIVAAYQTAAIHQDYCPPINVQQLKHALLDPAERKKVADLITHYKLERVSRATLDEAAARVRAVGPRELRQLLIRFIGDFSRHHRDARMLAVLQGLMERVNLAFDERTRQLSRINNTLYEFLLPDEQTPRDEQVLGHVIIKADVRDSTALTADLLSRGLNPASHFSLNFYEPLNKLLPKYAAEKVFIEGDAVILAIFDKEGSAAGGYPVARACGLAREMMEVVNAYNARAEKANLPRLEIGIGICWQNSAPLYLLDGETRIMISSAINLSDRLSGCSRLARRVLCQNESLFNIFIFQTISEEDAGGALEEFLVRYNTGVCLSEEAFQKLQQEISLAPLELEIPVLWDPERVILYCGSVPLAPDVFQRIVVREAHIPHVDPHDFAVKRYTEQRYYEVCTNRMVYEYTEQMAPKTANTVGGRP